MRLPLRDSLRLRTASTMIRSGFAYALIPLVGVVSAPLMAQALGPVGRGELAAVLQPLTVAGAFASLGVPAAVTFFVGRGFAERAVTRYGLTLSLISTTVVAACLVLYLPTIASVAHQPYWLVALIWASIVPGALVSIRRAVLQARRSYRPLDAERASSGLLRLGFVVALVLVGVTASMPFTAAYTVAGLLAMLWLLSPKETSSDSPNVAGSVERTEIWRYALLASIGVIATTLNNRLDQAILPAAMGAGALGVYSVAVTIAELPYVITAVMVRNLLAESSSRVGRKQLKATLLVGQAAVGACCLVLIALSPALVPFFFGAAFESAVPVTMVLCAATFAGSIAQAASTLLAGSGAPGWSSVAPLVGVACTIGGLALFWDSMNPLKAAFVALIAQIIVSAVTAIAFALRKSRAKPRLDGDV